MESQKGYEQELKLAMRISEAACKRIMAHFQGDFTIETKVDDSPVTIADKQAEECAREIMARETPDYGVVGEEFGVSLGAQSRQWVVDPIDGTKSFIHGVPLFGFLLALLEDGIPVVGLIALPALGHTLWATRGGGCFVDGLPCRVSQISELKDAMLLDGSSTGMEKHGYAESWQRLRQGAKLHRGWGDCYGHFLVATGRAEVMFDPIVNLWDVAPLGVILPEAGGCFTAADGRDSVNAGSGLSTNGILHQEILSRLRKVRTEG